MLDLGCAPGGWLQIAARRVGATGIVIGVDLEKVAPLTAAELGDSKASVHIICGDISAPETLMEVCSIASSSVDVVLSDMSPKLSGIRDSDIMRSLNLLETAFALTQRLLRHGGAFVAKLFPAPEIDAWVKEIARSFQKTKRVALDSSRQTSREFYLVALGYQKKTAA